MVAGRVYAAPRSTPEGATSDETPPTVVVVGAASRDLASSDRRGWRLGGAVTYASLALARLGLRVGCLIGVDDDASRAAELDLLRQSGADVRLVPLSAGPVFDNVEDLGAPGRRRQRWLSASDRIPAGALPPLWHDAPAWVFGPVAGELGPEWAAVPVSGARVGLGWQGLLREFSANGWVERTPPAASAVAHVAGLVVVSVDDVSGDAEIAAVRSLLRPDAVLVATAGSRGGVVALPVEGDRREASAGPRTAAASGGGEPAGPAAARGDAASFRRYAAVPAREVVDPTGAGDVFLAALMAAWLLSGERPSSPRALRFAAAAASCAVERSGVLGVPTAAEVAAKLRGAR